MSWDNGWLKSGWKVERSSYADDDGHTVESWASLIPSISAVFVEDAGSKRENRSKDEVLESGFIYCTYDSRISDIDRFVSPAGLIYEVQNVNDPHQTNDFLKVRVVRTDVQRDDEA